MSPARFSPLAGPAIAGALLAGALATALPGAPALAQQPGAADPVPPRPAPAPGAPAAPVTRPVVPQAAPQPAPADALKAKAEQAVTEKALKAAEAEAPEDAERAAACKTHALVKLKARSPSVDDIFIDMDGLTIAKAEDVSIGPEKITAVLMGEAYITRDRSDKAHRFLCLVGEKEKVVMTFFTER